MTRARYLIVIFFFSISLSFIIDLFRIHRPENAVHVLDVGQGDSQLIVYGGRKILIDTGPGLKILSSLEEVLPPGDSVIDLVVISHAEADHIGGLKYVLNKYLVGAVAWSGRSPYKETATWREAVSELIQKKIPVFEISEGDALKIEDAWLLTLAPDKFALQAGELNLASLVLLFYPEIGPSFIFLGDIDSASEMRIANKFDFNVDVIKVAHHGSRFSSALSFLRLLAPKIAVIGVGSGNSFGHPADQTLERIKLQVGDKVFRTDEMGTISFVLGEKTLISTQK